MTSRFSSLPARLALLGAIVAAPSHAGLPLDLGVFRASENVLYLDFNRDHVSDRILRVPQATHLLAADMNGDGIADVVAYHDGRWEVDLDLDRVPDATYFFGGEPGDVPLLGDVDGDGRVDLVVYRDGAWLASLRRDGTIDRVDRFGGRPGDVPVLGDLDCNGVADRIVYNAGLWYADLDGDGNPEVIAGFGGDPADRPFVVDWDGDCYADLGVYRDGQWFVLVNPLAQPRVEVLDYGGPGDAPIAARLDRALGSPKFERTVWHSGIFRPATGALYFRTTPGPNPDLVLNPDVAATHVLAADLRGRGRSGIVLYRDGIWIVDDDVDGAADELFAFGGAPDDVPLVGDVDGDGRPDLVIYRDGIWFVSTARDGSVALVHGFGGAPGDVPVLADVDGDGKADFGIYRAGAWYFDTRRDGTVGLAYAFGGAPGDVPLVTDWNGDGRPDLVIYRAGTWYVSTDPASSLTSAIETFGTSADVPVAGTFVAEASVAPVLLAMQPRPIGPLGEGMLAPTIADFDGDGSLEPLGGRNDRSGGILAAPLSASGLASMFSPGRVNRDCRAADFDGDGYVDLVCNTYSALDRDASFARLYRGDGTGSFAEDPAFAALDIRGYGETIVAADFDNDGAVDLFLPQYSHNDPREHSRLLRNDGHGRFTDISDAAGVALRDVPADHRVEGAQAVDYDDDGWIDLYVGGRLFRNNGDLTFTDVTAAVGLPGDFDEGAKFVDWNNDGRLDLVIHHPLYGPSLWEFDGARFARRMVMPRYLLTDAYGFNVADLNGDGREDVIISGGANAAPFVLLNTGTGFERDPLTLVDNLTVGPLAAFDVDGDGAIDLVFSRDIRSTVLARNISPGVNRRTLTVEIVDAAGRRNQFGRVARIRPQGAGATMTRVVDGGSGLLAQAPYALTVPTPYAGTHRVDVRFAAGTVTFSMQPGERVRVYADGRSEPF